MPNWCSNELTIVGKPKMLNKLLKQITTTESEANDNNGARAFDFEKIMPMPKGVDWYEWRNANWQTKWNASDVQFLTDGDWTENYTDETWESGELNLMFNTAWSPPIPVITQLSKDNPKVAITHKFTEEGMAFYGTYEYSNGDVEVVKEGSFERGTPCEIYLEYYGDSSHHSCDQCGEWFDCDGEPQDLCVDCEKELLDTDKELWGEVNETIAKETQSFA